jgi:hypothetical protein
LDYSYIQLGYINQLKEKAKVSTRTNDYLYEFGNSPLAIPFGNSVGDSFWQKLLSTNSSFSQTPL